MSATAVAPPSKEEIALIQLKDRIPDILERQCYEGFNDELYLIRWLKAKHLNAEKTEQLIRNSLSWRIENSLDLPPNQELTSDYFWNYQIFSDGVDRDGIPVFSMSAGSWPLREIVEAGEKDKFIRYMAQVYVIIEDAMIKLNRERYEKQKLEDESVASKLKNTSGVIIIVDLKGYSRSQLTSLKTVETSLEIASMAGNYFPDMAEKVYLINVSKVFTVLFKMIKPLVNFHCVEVFDSNEAKWKAAILSHINPDQLRPAFGGTKVDPCMIKITTCEDIQQCTDMDCL